MFILGSSSDEMKNGCGTRSWVQTVDQADYELPKGFTRPTTVTFPVFTFGPTPQLTVDCEVFLCRNGDNECNVDYANCLDVVNPNTESRRRKRRNIPDAYRLSVSSVPPVQFL